MGPDEIRLERETLLEFHRAAAAGDAREAGLEVVEVGSATALIAAHDPSIVLNRAIGLGVEAPATRDDVRRLRDLYADRGLRRWYLHLHAQAQPADLRDWLVEAGFERGRGWMGFERDADRPPLIPTELAIGEATPEDAAGFGRVVSAAFDMTEATGRILARLVGRPGWIVAVARDDGDVVAGGAVLVRGGVGWCDWAGTAPTHRRRGAQGAIASYVIALAIERGCRRFLTETGEAVPGEEQHSYRNIERMGFRTGVVRENWSPATPD